MIHSRFVRLLAIFFVFLVWTGFPQAMFPKLPFEEVAQSADLIFVGTVEMQQSRINELGNMILTDVFFKDIEVVFATERSVQKDSLTILLAHAGGCVDDLCLGVSVAPFFEDGLRYLVFMVDDGRPYASPIVGSPQGYFKVMSDSSTGEEFVLTVGGKPVVKADQIGIAVSKRRITHIQSGSPVYEKASETIPESFFFLPPTLRPIPLTERLCHTPWPWKAPCSFNH
ncbi:hypothetical protein ACFLRM_03195 [Acidobacteriota bacterium]